MVDESKRRFLKNLAIGTAGCFIAPRILFGNGNGGKQEIAVTPTRNIHVGLIQEIDGDALYEDYFKNGEDSLIMESLRNAADFYSDALKINIAYVDTRSNLDLFDYDSPTKVDFIFNYTTPEKFVERLVKDNHHIIRLLHEKESEDSAEKLAVLLSNYNKDDAQILELLKALDECDGCNYKDFVNKEVAGSYRRLIDSTNAALNEAGKYRTTDNAMDLSKLKIKKYFEEIVSKIDSTVINGMDENGYDYKEYVNNEIARRIGTEMRDVGGVCVRQTASTGAGMLFLTAKDAYNKVDLTNPETRARALEVLRYTNAHQFGHLLGLDHGMSYYADGTESKLIFASDRANIMNHPVYEPHWNYKMTHSPTLNSKQIEIVSNYLQTGRYPASSGSFLRGD